MLIAAVRHGLDTGHLARVMMRAHWADDADLSDIETLIKIGEMADMNASSLLETAQTLWAQASHDANTEEAIERSVFGSLTYFIDGDMFYGQDRLELVEHAFKRPFRGAWPKG